MSAKFEFKKKNNPKLFPLFTDSNGNFSQTRRNPSFKFCTLTTYIIQNIINTKLSKQNVVLWAIFTNNCSNHFTTYSFFAHSDDNFSKTRRDPFFKLCTLTIYITENK